MYCFGKLVPLTWSVVEHVSSPVHSTFTSYPVAPLDALQLASTYQTGLSSPPPGGGRDAGPGRLDDAAAAVVVPGPDTAAGIMIWCTVAVSVAGFGGGVGTVTVTVPDVFQPPHPYALQALT